MCSSRGTPCHASQFNTWMARAVRDEAEFGLPAGAQLDLKTTLCFESRAAREAIVVDNLDEDPHYCGHHTSKIYGLQISDLAYSKTPEPSVCLRPMHS